MTSGFSRTLAAMGLFVWLSFGGVESAVAGAAKNIQFDIPAQLLSTALLRFSEQAKVQVTAPSQLVGSRRTEGVHGEYGSAQALERMLEGSGLAYEFINEKAVAIWLAGSEADVTRQEDDVKLTQAATPVPSQGEGEDQKGSSSRISEIVVTAQKREERLQDVPQSVSVLTAEDLSRLGATQFRDFANTVPGLSFSTDGAGLTQISLRGVTAGYDLSQTVGVYVDDVPYGSSNAFGSVGARNALDVGLFDLDRVEVLRGPQGTLYGASTMGGLVKYVTRQPDEAGFELSGQSGVSSTEDGGVSYNGALAVNIPLDSAALRLGAFYSRDGGYIDNLALGNEDVNRSDTSGGRADLLLTPTDALSIRITAFTQDIVADGRGTADYTLAGVPVDGSLDQRRLTAEPYEQHFRLLSGTIAYDLDWAALTSISSYQEAEMETTQDLSAYAPFFGPYSALGLNREGQTEKFTQEIRFTSQSEPTGLEWLIGVYYTDERVESRSAYAPRDFSGQPSPDNLFTGSAPSRYEEHALFGDLTYHFTDKFDVSGGVRYARNDQTYSQVTSGIFGSSDFTERSDEEVFTYLANARYQFSERATGYLRYATGFRPGGPNFFGTDPITGLPIAPPTFDSDELTSYEIGYRAETSDRRYGLDLSTYHIDWSNIQINAVRSNFGFIANAPGGASIRGAELSLMARPTDSLTLTGAFAFQDATLSEADPDLGGAKGERLPNVPRFTGSLNIDYDLPILESVQPTIGATVRHVSDRMASFDASPAYLQYELPAYTSVDFRAGATLGSVELQLFFRNAFDERGQLSAINTGLASPAIMQPRTIGLTASARF